MRDVGGAGGIVFHRQVLVVLFGAASGQDRPLDQALFQPLAHVAAGQFPQPYFFDDHYCFIPLLYFILVDTRTCRSYHAKLIGA